MPSPLPSPAHLLTLTQPHSCTPTTPTDRPCFFMGQDIVVPPSPWERPETLGYVVPELRQNRTQVGPGQRRVSHGEGEGAGVRVAFKGVVRRVVPRGRGAWAPHTPHTFPHLLSATPTARSAFSSRGPSTCELCVTWGRGEGG